MEENHLSTKSESKLLDRLILSYLPITCLIALVRVNGVFTTSRGINKTNYSHKNEFSGCKTLSCVNGWF
jgi:hypothetical protein